MLWDEAQIVRDRVNDSHIDTAVLTNLAVSAIFSKEAEDKLNELSKRAKGKDDG